MQRMLQRHTHRAEHLVHFVADARARLLSLVSRERRITLRARRGGLEREPAQASRQHRALGHAVAQRLEGTDRATELLANRNVFDGGIDRGLDQARRFGSQCDP